MLRDLAGRIRAIEGAVWIAPERERTNPTSSSLPAPDAPRLPPSFPLEVLPRARGVVHECFGLADPVDPGFSPTPAFRRAKWSPPLCFLVHLARAALETDEMISRTDAEIAAGSSRNPSGPVRGVTEETGATREEATSIVLCLSSAISAPLREISPGRICWIGRACWPYPRLLFDDRPGESRLYTDSVFIDPPDLQSRLWAIDLALRTPGVSIVIADGSGLSMAATRRLQLAAASRAAGTQRAASEGARREGSGGVNGTAGSPSRGSGAAWCMLVRPPHELTQLSAAATRWLIRRASLDTSSHAMRARGRESPFTAPLTGERRPTWTVELLRHKGMWFGVAGSSGMSRAAIARDQDAARLAVLEWDHETGACVVSAHVVRGPDQAPGEMPPSRARCTG